MWLLPSFGGKLQAEIRRLIVLLLVRIVGLRLLLLLCDLLQRFGARRWRPVYQKGFAIFFSLVGKGQPSLSHDDQGSLVGGVRHMARHLDAVPCVQPIEGYSLAWRHLRSPTRQRTYAA